MPQAIPVLKGNVILHPKIKTGYFEQEQTTLKNDLSVYETVEKLMIGETSTMVRKHLAKFLFKGNDVFKKVEMLSGGEKVRLIFATFVLKKYDLIIMDEPTNHLDMSAKEELESVLKQYAGTLIVISHDRYFMNEVIDKIFHIEDGNYQIYEGNYEAFLKQKVSLRTETKKVKQKKEIRVKDKKNSTKKVELEIEKLEQLKKELENQTLDPQVYNDWEKLKSINFELTKISTDLDQLYEVLFQ